MTRLICTTLSSVKFLIYFGNSDIIFNISAPGERSDEISPDTECPDSSRVPTQKRGKTLKP